MSTSDRLDDHLSPQDIEALMMPDTYLPYKHRSRKMPKRKPRTNAVWTSESERYRGEAKE